MIGFSLTWVNKDKTILAVTQGNHTVIVEPDHDDWDELSQSKDITLFVEKAAVDPLTSWRSTTSCSRMQGILALGQTRWSAIQLYKDTATWGEKMVIDESSIWNRGSQDIAFFAYLLSLTDIQVDDLFKLAITIKV